jgi:hypothetical protein
MIFRLVFPVVFLAAACLLAHLGIAIIEDSGMPFEIAAIAKLGMGGFILMMGYGFACDIKNEIYWRRRFGTSFLPFWLDTRTRQPMPKYK